MMPKSTATMRPSASTNRLPGCMSAWKKPSRSAWRRKVWISARPSAGRSSPRAASAARSVSGVPSIHSSVSTSRAVRSQSTVGTRKSGSSLVFSRISEMRGGFEPQVHLDRDRARQRVDHLDQAQPPRLGRMALGGARREVERVEIALEAPLDAGPQHLHGDRAAVGDLGAVHLRDRGGRDRGAERREDVAQRLGRARSRPRPRPRPAETAPSGPAGFPDRARARRRPRRGASRGTGRASRRSARAASARPTSRTDAPPLRRPLDQPREPQAEPRRRGQRRRIDQAEHALAREHEAGARQTKQMRRSQRSQAPAGMQRDDAAAHRPMRHAAEAGRAHHRGERFGRGKRRIDSTR